MRHFSEMEWNSKWDWENLVMCGSKSIECPKKLQLAADCMIVDDGETDAGSFNPSSGCGNSGASGSDSGHVYSAKSSISASTDSSTKDGMRTPSFRLMSFDGFSGNFGEEMELKGAKLSGTSLHPDSSVGSGEQLIGLKLGKRTYFENSSGGGNVKNASIPVVPTPSIVAMKKTKSSGQMLPAPRCIVEGCNFDLSIAKEYHRKHRVCENHAKYPKVIVGGLERRFCQQCSRFHSLSEFDEKKRSCRRRLSDHNARRRKPKQETIQFNSTRLSSPFYEGRQPMGFLLNNASLINFSSPANAAWTSTSNSKFTVTKGYSLRSNEDEVTNRQMHMPGMRLPPVPNMQDNPTPGFSAASKYSTPEVLNPGSEGSLMSSHVDTAPQYSRALSLLSTNSWGSVQHPNPMPENGTGTGTYTATTQPMMMMMDTIPIPENGVMGCWGTTQSSSSSSGNGFQQQASYEAADMFSNVLN